MNKVFEQKILATTYISPFFGCAVRPSEAALVRVHTVDVLQELLLLAPNLVTLMVDVRYVEESVLRAALSSQNLEVLCFRSTSDEKISGQACKCSPHLPTSLTSDSFLCPHHAGPLLFLARIMSSPGFVSSRILLRQLHSGRRNQLPEAEPPTFALLLHAVCRIEAMQNTMDLGTLTRSSSESLDRPSIFSTHSVLGGCSMSSTSNPLLPPTRAQLEHAQSIQRLPPRRGPTLRLLVQRAQRAHDIPAHRRVVAVHAHPPVGAQTRRE
jgi:hypothetical protein